MKLTSTICIAFVAAFAGSAHAQIIVQDGDNLQAAINSAPSGSVVEIQSNATFTGSIVWANKDLVLRAGSGFTPVIKGSVTVSSTTGPSTSALQDLSIRGGLSVNAGSLADDILALDVSNCDLAGIVSIGATKSAICTLDFFRTTSRMSVVAQTSDLARLRFTAVESGFGRNLIAQSFHSSAIELDVKRSRVNRTLTVFNSSAGVSALRVESSLIVGPGGFASSPGVDIGPNVAARLVNTTITGYGVGLRGDAQTTGENLLCFGNASADIGPGITSGQIANSLIQDGTFAGVNGNFGGTPLVGPDYRLLPGSIGIDAGNDAALALGTRDFYGDARIQDGDGDGVSHVDVGAVEL
ncbi:MAG: hypothetical protein L6Q99_04550 [Planctomycetes bacterium]|nr:hypothetical protein [Planctomycetota bacterium]